MNKLVWIKRKPSKNPVTGDTVKSLRQCRLDESAVTFEGKMNVFWKVSVEVKLVKWHFLLVLFFFWTFSNQFIAILSSSLATRQPEYYCVDLAKSVGGKKKKKRDQILAHIYRLQSLGGRCSCLWEDALLGYHCSVCACLNLCMDLKQIYPSSSPHRWQVCPDGSG